MAFSALFVCTVLIPASAHGEFSMLVGEFDGGEPRLPTHFCESAGLGSSYQTVEFTVSTSGNYAFTSAFSSWDWWDGDLPGFGLDTEVMVYQGTINLADLQENQLAYLGDFYSEVSVPLEAGQAFTLMITNPCWDNVSSIGTWAVMLSGPGPVQSPARREIPEISTGSFDPAAPAIKGRCGEKMVSGDATFKQLGPIRVSRSGTYYFANVRQLGASATCQAVYTAPVDHANIEANLVGNGHSGSFGNRPQFADQWELELQADTDYWLLIQPQTSSTALGTYFFVMAPPAPVRINPGMTGLWANIGTPGQGMYLDVFNSIDSVFMAWFTYDLQRPGPSVSAVLGDPGHRWLTGLGAIEGNTSKIDAVWTAGGLFDASNPKPSRTLNGQIRLEFDSCTSGRAIYEFGTPSLSGTVNLQRPYEDVLSIAQCEQFIQGPGIPGPL
jgi:hypothetical protein